MIIGILVRSGCEIVRQCATMLDISTLLVFGFLYLVCYMFFSSRRLRNLPPGPKSLSPFGNLYYVFNNQKFHQTVDNLAKKYGSVFSLQLCSYPVVFISDLDILQDTLLHNSNYFSDRPADNPFIKMVFRNKGILFQNGKKWKKLRSLALCTFHEFGIKGSRIQEKINIEVAALLNNIQKCDKKFSSEIFRRIIANVMCNVLFGHRYDYDDPEFVQLVNDFNTVFSDAGFQNIFHFLPVVFFPLMPIVQRKSIGIIAACGRIVKVFERSIEVHRQLFDPCNISDFVDIFLEAEQKEKVINPNSDLFCDGQILQVLVDLIATGAETSSTSLQWLMYFLILHPNIQHKCRKQILEICGKDKLPTLNDRFKMPYVEATILEVLRLGNIASIPPMRENSKEMKVNGYTIPAKSIIIQNIYSIHLSPKHWSEPHKFIPERFLDKDGNLVKSPALLAFGLGRRTCLGQNLAKMELLIFLCAILQKYQLEAWGKLPDQDEAEFGLTLKLPVFSVKAVDIEDD